MNVADKPFGDLSDEPFGDLLSMIPIKFPKGF